MLKSKGINIGIIAFLLIMAGCGKGQKPNIIPESNLPSEEQEKIRDTLHDMNYMEKADRLLFAKKYGKE